MKQHRTIWAFTVAIALVALVTIAYRNWPEFAPGDAPSASPELPDTLDTQIAHMLPLLEKDPRVRRTGTWSAVRAVAKRAQSDPSPRAEAVYALGLVLFYADEDYRAAERAFRQAAVLKPAWAWPHNNLAILFFREERLEESDASFEEAKRLAPDWSRPHSDRAILLRIDGNLEGALEEARTAADMDPENAATRNNLGNVLHNLGEYKLAEAEYIRATTLDPDLASPQFNLACLYTRLGDTARALPFLETTLELDPNFAAYAESDPDLEALRMDPAFEALLAPYRKRLEES